MLQQRRGSKSNIDNSSNSSISNRISNIHSNHLDNPNSAKSSAISCQSEQDLRSPCYCEENVWRLAYRRIFGPAKAASASASISTSTSNGNATVDKENEQYYVVFVSNDEECCPMLNQRASKHPDEPCFWDYHVILIQCSQQRHINSSNSNKHSKAKQNTLFAQVLDMDSKLSFPCTLDEYLDGTFKLDFLDDKARKKYSPKFRVIRAELFLQHFYSDRMHMFQNGKWSSPPPSYDCILTDLQDMKLNRKGNMSNLSDFVSMGGGKGKEPPFVGDILTLKELRSKFGE